MSTDRNLLFGVLALQIDLIDTVQFAEVCSVWATRKDISLADLLIELGWLEPVDRADVDRLLQRKLKKHGGDPQASLAEVAGEDVHRCLADIADPHVQHSLAQMPSASTRQLDVTVDYVPRTEDRYAQPRLHASGGIGQVWVAYDMHLGRDVALKKLRPERASHRVSIERFLNEAQITGQLEHPGIVPVYDLCHASGDEPGFYTMRFVQGRTLKDAIRQYHDQPSETVTVSVDLVDLLNAFVVVCNTVAYAHSRGVIHRDLKGQNVILGEFGEVIVLDWGLAKVIGHNDADAEVDPDPMHQGSSDLTLQGEVIGTPAYMSPEQAAGMLGPMDHRTDIYALGALLYEILTGQPPFGGSNTEELLRRIREEDPIPPSQLRGEVPAILEAACLRAMAKDPGHRYTSARELGDEVERWQQVQRRQAEEALRESRALYHSLVETLPLCLWRKDVDSRFTFVNERLCRELETTMEQVVGKTDFDFFLAEEAVVFQAGDRHVLTTGETFESTEEHTDPLGATLYVRTVKIPIYNSRGEVIGTQGIYWDVTELKHAEKALRDSEALYRSLVDVLPLILVRKDREGRFIFANKRFCESRGTPLEEILGKTDDDLFPAEMADKYRQDDQRVVQTEEILETTEEYTSPHEGSVFVHVMKSPVYDSDGECIGIQAVCWDVTDLKRLEEDLAQANAKLARYQQPPP